MKGLVSMGLSKEARKARNAYMRKWRKNNPERVKQHQKRYWERVVKQQQEQEDNQDKQA